RGKILVSAARDDGERLVLSVRDSGPGIPSHELDAALAAFARGSLANRRAIHRARPGPPIVKGLVRLHEGELAIRSAAGRGTVASAIFPRRRLLAGAAQPGADPLAVAS